MLQYSRSQQVTFLFKDEYLSTAKIIIEINVMADKPIPSWSVEKGSWAITRVKSLAPFHY